MELFHIVPMEACHVREMAVIERECFSDPWSERSIEEELVNPNAVYMVAEWDGAVVGYAGMHAIVGEGYITNVAVSPDFRRCGVAAALMEALFAYGHENALELITLEVRPSNQGAIALYTRFGFRCAGLRKNYYRLPREDALIMTAYLKKKEKQGDNDND